MATITLVGKVATMPALTTVQHKMNNIQTEVSQGAQATTKEIQNIKDELKNLTANVQKSITAGEGANAAARVSAFIEHLSQPN